MITLIRHNDYLLCKEGDFSSRELLKHRPAAGRTNLELGMKVQATAVDGGVLLRSAGGRSEVWNEGEAHTYGTRYTKQNRPPNGGLRAL